jgi:hypothetical protein
MAEDIVALAKEAGAELGIPWTYVYGQWAHETGNFTSYVADVYHNLAGIKNYNDMSEYQGYGSLKDFKDAYVRLLKRYEGVPNAPSLETFITNLKSGGYFGDTLQNYYQGVLNQIKEAGDYPEITSEAIKSWGVGAPASGTTLGKVVSDLTGAGTIAEKVTTRAGYILAGIAIFAVGAFSIFKMVK